MTAQSQPLDPELYRLTRTVALDALRRLKELVAEGKDFDTSHRHPRFDEDGITFRPVSRRGPITSYHSAIGIEANAYFRPFVAYEELDGFSAFRDHASSIEGLQEFLTFLPFADDPEMVERSHLVWMGQFPLRILEHHIHCVGWDFSEDLFLETYCRAEKFWFVRQLPVEVLVPVIGVSFTSDLVELTNGHYLERMSDGLQLSRMPYFHVDTEQLAVLPSSTHALVIPGFSLTYANTIWPPTVSQDPIGVDAVRAFFQALSIEQPFPSGFVQYVFRPVGWADGFEGALPPLVHGPVVRRYSPRLAGGMKEPTITLGVDAESRLASTFEQLLAPPKKISIAAGRLQGSMMRDQETDRILDLCIGIESLVSDNSPGDTTYKLALRTTAVLASKGVHATADVFAAMKGIYGYRSAVAHGAKNAEKKRKVNVFGANLDASNLAEYMLRELLSVFIAAGDMTAEDVDKKFLLDPLSTVAKISRDAEDESAGEGDVPRPRSSEESTSAVPEGLD
ncbi:hypothetical protein [Micromonospora taraxaci]|uniref:hypothetical protein n=1 Tax=Micromonospora taraxaci TaxID=1316803 RepID=UPI0033AF59AF